MPEILMPKGDRHHDFHCGIRHFSLKSRRKTGHLSRFFDLKNDTRKSENRNKYTIMKKIYDKEKINKALSICGYADMMAGFQVPLMLIQYDAGENHFGASTPN